MSENFEGKTPESRFLGLSRPVTGALVGILLFFLVTYSARLVVHRSLALMIISFAFEIWGRLPLSAMSAFAGIDLPETIAIILVPLISMIPPGVLGWIIGSRRRSTRMTGIVLLVIYLLLTIGPGSLLTLMAI
jgi:hypothetical protein